MSSQNRFKLFQGRRFAPFFWTQFFGAFNDNVFKNALIILIAYSSQSTTLNATNALSNVAQALFILPYFLLSPLAGQFADKLEKSRFIRITKLYEITIMILAALAFYYQQIYLLLGLLFCLGAQATFFGPVKYSILPQHLAPEELIEGNALVESATFIAILLGTIIGGIIIALTGIAHVLIGISLVSVAIIGWFNSRRIPFAPAADPQLKIDWNIVAQIKHTLAYAYANNTVFLALLGISWFWFYGAVILTEIPNYCRLYLGGSEAMVTLLFATFSIGISIGSLLCNHFSKLRLELGLVPFGSIGLSLFVFVLYGFTPETLQHNNASPLILLQELQTWGIVISALLMGVFGGLYSVPLYVIMQQQSDVQYRSRVVAANNILNAIFVVLSALFGIVLVQCGLSIPQLFVALGIVNILVSAYIYNKLPLFLIRLVAWFIVSVFFKIEVVNREHIPEKGAAMIVCNHVSYMDALIISTACRRHIYFVMDYQIFKHPLLNFLFKRVGTIPIASEKQDISIKRAAFENIALRLEEGELVGVFPEGILTYTGEINLFRRGIEQALKTSPVPIIPMAIQGLWGSYFTRDKQHYLRRLFQQIRRPIKVVIGAPVPAIAATASHLQTVVMDLMRSESVNAERD